MNRIITALRRSCSAVATSQDQAGQSVGRDGGVREELAAGVATEAEGLGFQACGVVNKDCCCDVSAPKGTAFEVSAPLLPKPAHP